MCRLWITSFASRLPHTTDACIRKDDRIIENRSIDGETANRFRYTIIFSVDQCTVGSAQSSSSLQAGLRKANDSIFDRQRKQSEEIRTAIWSTNGDYAQHRTLMLLKSLKMWIESMNASKQWSSRSTLFIVKSERQLISFHRRAKKNKQRWTRIRKLRWSNQSKNVMFSVKLANGKQIRRQQTEMEGKFFLWTTDCLRIRFTIQLTS